MCRFTFKSILNGIIYALIALCPKLDAMHIEVTIGKRVDSALIEKDKLCLFCIKDGFLPEVVTSGNPDTSQQHYLSRAIEAGSQIAKQQKIYTTNWRVENGSLKQIHNK